jgi:hypothetical protein
MAKQETLREILVRIECNLETIKEDIIDLKKLENRIESLERSRSQMKGMAMVMIPILFAAGGILVKIISHLNLI